MPDTQTEAEVWDDWWTDEDRQNTRVDASLDWLRAVRMLLTTWQDDCERRTWRSAWLKAACLLAMLLGREGIDHGDRPGPKRWCWQLTMGAWGYQKLYAGWEATFLYFHPRQFRFEIGTDGDWCM